VHRDAYLLVGDDIYFRQSNARCQLAQRWNYRAVPPVSRRPGLRNPTISASAASRFVSKRGYCANARTDAPNLEYLRNLGATSPITVFLDATARLSEKNTINQIDMFY
jgi:hypothetical protein